MDMQLLKEAYEAKLRASENRIEYLKKIVEEQKKALMQKDEIIKQILEIKQILKNNFSEGEKLRSSIIKNKIVPLYSKKAIKLISYNNKKRNKL